MSHFIETFFIMRKSVIYVNKSFCTSKHRSVRVLNEKIAFVVPFPATNPNYCSDISGEILDIILFSITLKSILITWLIILIVRCLLQPKCHEHTHTSYQIHFQCHISYWTVSWAPVRQNSPSSHFSGVSISSYTVIITHLCPPLRSKFAVRETASLGIMGEPRVPPLNPSESIVLSEHYRLWGV